MTCTQTISRYSLRRFLTALLVLVVLLGAQAPVRALAEASAWVSLQDAIDRAENGEVITLSEDITALPGDARLTIASGKHVTLDLNGHALNRNQQAYTANNGSVLYVRRDAVLVIADNGTGFDAGTAQGEGGTHIGLANVRDRVERLCRGSMTIDSRPGEGTAVTLRLPAAPDTLR